MATIASLERDFKNLVKHEALAQAYVLHGPGGAVQFEFAKGLAYFLETGDWAGPTNQLTKQPTNQILLDAKFVDGTAQDLGVDVTREFSEFLYRQPVASPRRTLVINSAAEFTDRAQNAILKIVEEPPSHALIILTVRDVNSLLPALRSRLQKVWVAASGTLQESSEERRANELVEQFFLSAPGERSKLVKALIDEDKELKEKEIKSEQIADHFVRALIVELAKKPEQNWQALKELLKRQTAMGDYTTSRKLQLEAALQYLK